MSESLPEFRFYPDPVSDGTLERATAVCGACERARGWIATSLLYAADVPEDARFCPWCIADGSAAARFNEIEAGAAPALAAIVERRTPGFVTWQDWAWVVHCGEPAVYLGQPRAGEFRQYPDACDDLRAQTSVHDWPPGQVEELIDALDPEASVTGYLFRCDVCGAHLARWDAD
ncbi:CbrC family protein [Solirubrobacter sp. CPCC 204708]|uniref:CbrC family protein n=1 Tax=Solirubrobacter deserti TaxID=2282478 RepID=A0ABT4RV42_9ACTN|nr:CbrC family protein [Solirubrobacter deserti]MBE2314969.1 CbrC family protein [Solirubrobacter deserti]MDA0142459.1 CbrC family protein [Solirubrobacter deserti]